MTYVEFRRNLADAIGKNQFLFTPNEEYKLKELYDQMCSDHDSAYDEGYEEGYEAAKDEYDDYYEDD